jgi:hypothetical protein
VLGYFVPYRPSANDANVETHLSESQVPNIDPSRQEPGFRRTPTWVELDRLSAAKYHREDGLVQISFPVYPDPAADVKKRSRAFTYRTTPNLDVATSGDRLSPRLSSLASVDHNDGTSPRMTCNELLKESRSDPLNIQYQFRSFSFPKPSAGSPEGDPSLRESTICPKRLQREEVHGLGLTIGTSSGWKVSSESRVNTMLDVEGCELNQGQETLWQSLNKKETLLHFLQSSQSSDYEREETLKQFLQSCEEQVEKEIEDDIISFSQDEPIKEYNGPAYADRIAKVLSEANLAPVLPSVPFKAEQDDFTPLFQEMIVQRFQKKIHKESAAECDESIKEHDISVTVPSSPLDWIEAPTVQASNNQVMRQATSATALPFQLPLRVEPLGGDQYVCFSPKHVRRGSLQAVKVVTKRASLIPGLHLPSASLDSESSSHHRWAEMTTSTSQRLFQDELQQFSSSPEAIRYPVASVIKSYNDEEREIEAASRQVQRRPRSSTWSTNGPLQSRFSSYTTTTSSSVYSQDSTPPNAFNRLSIVSDIDDSCDPNIRQGLLNFNTQLIRQSILSSYARRSSIISSISSIPSSPAILKYRSGIEDFRLSSFPTVPPLSFGQCMQPPPSHSEYNGKGKDTPRTLQLKRRLSNNSNDDDYQGNSTEASSSPRDSDFFSPTMSMLELYQDNRNTSEIPSGTIEELP